MKKRVIAVLVSCVMVFSMTACSSTKETVETESVIETETEEETFKAIGTEAENAFCVKMKNATGLDIVGVAVKLTEDEDFDTNLLLDGDVFKADEERTLFYEMPVGDDMEEEVTDDEKLLTQGYDIQLTFADESVKVLHAFPFEDIAEGVIYLEDEVAFVKYESMTSGEEVSTKEAEIATKQAEEAAAQVEEVYEEDYTYDDNVSWGDSSSDNSGSSLDVPDAPAQDAEDCLGDDALTW